MQRVDQGKRTVDHVAEQTLGGSRRQPPQRRLVDPRVTNLECLVAPSRKPAEQPTQTTGQIDERCEIGVAPDRQLRNVHRGAIVTED